MLIEEITDPFRCWVVDDFLPEYGAVIHRALLDIPSPYWDGWVKYDNELERGKRTTEQVEQSANLRSLFQALEEKTPFVKNLLAIPDLDSTRRCGGLHITDPGGFLATHLDASLYPDGRERRANLVLFMNQSWPVDGGGEFELYRDDAREVAEKIRPKFNRAVIWESSDLAYHGVSPVARDASPRITAAVYYLAPARLGASRRRALFVPPR